MTFILERQETVENRMINFVHQPMVEIRLKVSIAKIAL